MIYSETSLKNLATAFADSFFLHGLGGDQIVKRADIKYIAVLSCLVQFSSVAQSQPRESQHARPPSPTPGIYPNSCPSSQ